MYYIDESSGMTCPNGSVRYLSPGPWASLAAVRNCPVGSYPESGPDTRPRRSVRVTGEADTFFSIPARCSLNGRKVSGYLTTEATYLDAPEGYCFIPFDREGGE